VNLLNHLVRRHQFQPSGKGLPPAHCSKETHRAISTWAPKAPAPPSGTGTRVGGPGRRHGSGNRRWRRAADYEIQSSEATWSLVGTIDPRHVFSANVQPQFWGAYIFTANGVEFNPHVMPTSIRQIIVPLVRVPDGNSHTYKLVFHLRTNGTTTTRYQLDNQAPVTVANGAATVEFIDTVQATPNPKWWYWTMGNANGDPWVSSPAISMSRFN
jgi:hypothetical protein